MTATKRSSRLLDVLDLAPDRLPVGAVQAGEVVGRLELLHADGGLDHVQEAEREALPHPRVHDQALARAVEVLPDAPHLVVVAREAAVPEDEGVLLRHSEARGDLVGADLELETVRRRLAAPREDLARGVLVLLAGCGARPPPDGAAPPRSPLNSTVELHMRSVSSANPNAQVSSAVSSGCPVRSIAFSTQLRLSAGSSPSGRSRIGAFMSIGCCSRLSLSAGMNLLVSVAMPASSQAFTASSSS